MAEIGSEDTAKIKKVVVAEAEETVNANVMCLTNEETKSKEEAREEVLLVEKKKDNNDKSNSTDAFLSLKKCNEDVTINNSKDNSCPSRSTDEKTLKIDNSTNEINNVKKDAEETKQKEKVQENNDLESENHNVAMISEEIEKSNKAKTEAHSTNEKDTIGREQPTGRLESITTGTNEEKVLEQIEIRKEIHKDNINIDEETSLEEEKQELKKEFVKKKKLINNDEQLEVGIVGPPTAVSDLINEEELHGESALSAEEKIQDHVAEWVEKSVASEVLITGETEEEEENEIASNCRRRRRNLRERRKRKKENEDLPAMSTRKSQKIVSNIIKRSIKCLNKMHAMEGSGGNGKRVDAAEKTREEDSSRTSPKVPQNQQNGAALPEEAAATADRLRSSLIKKEPLGDSELVETNTKKALPSSDGSQQKERTPTRSLKSDLVENLGKKRRSLERQLPSNGNATTKKFCLERRAQYTSLEVDCEKLSPDELAAKAKELLDEVKTLDKLAHSKELEWNEILEMRKMKELDYLRIERKRQVLVFMEGNRPLGESLPPANLSLGQEWESSDSTTPVSKEKCSFESKEDVMPEESSQDLPTFKKEKSSKASSHRQVTPPKQTGENGRKQMEAMSPENRQIGEGRQGTIIDVRSIIADHKLRHPEYVPRRGRRMRNSVNVGLSAGGAMVETGHNVDSRPSSTDSCKSNSNTNDPNNSMNYRDVLFQFAKMSQQQAPSATSQTMQTQSTGSLLHGILTKSQSPRPTTFSPTLARLLTAPERERNIPTVSLPQQSTGTHLLQPYQGSTPVSISDLLSSSKARTEITITPVVNTAMQSHSNNLIHVEDVEEEAAVIEDRETRISSGGRDNRDDNAPRCQGCHECAAQFVCAGCGNQWYCSRECQVAAWDEHSELCTG
ncbi:PREDICTED: uncharacterized protein LOC107067616 isoform X2 [Polistes dominula]|uniref:Uncharacterized protein LOC107067616 isoform X2 n=1 Tax=Polistes dominula TaxID=743375 RepID=A0ABM1IEX7_POLDO|nr:PREDICTED: uncharacterized protein LOC107067616 isoform X2 [Polistes dominula]